MSLGTQTKRFCFVSIYFGWRKGEEGVRKQKSEKWELIYIPALLFYNIKVKGQHKDNKEQMVSSIFLPWDIDCAKCTDL